MEYSDLSSAVAAAKDGDVIELMRDIELPNNTALARIKFDRPGTYTLLGHGHTITFARNPENGEYIGGFIVSSGATLNLGTPDDLAASKLRMDGEGSWGSDPFIGVSGEGSVVNMYDGVVLTNIVTSGSAAGIVQINTKATFNMFGGELSNCLDAILGMGGAFLVDGYYDGGATLNITGGKIVNNRCSTAYGGGNGAGIYSLYGTINLSNCEISGNMAVQDDGITPADPADKVYPYGGAVFAYGGTLTMDNCFITGNYSVNGGGVCLYKATATIKNSTIKGNTAYNGAGIFAYSSENLTISGCTIEDNVCYDWGGGVYGYKSAIAIDGGSITGNRAIFGGGLVNQYGSVTVGSGTAICNNTAAAAADGDPADSAGDDVCNVGGTLTLGVVPDGLTLNPCGHVIDGWYDDGTDGQRWNVDDDTKEQYVNGVEPATFTDNIALKAAHNESPKTPGEDGPQQPVLLPQLIMWMGSTILNTDAHEAYIIGYEDDTVRPENNITRAEVATIFFRLLSDDYRASKWSTENSFCDVNVGDWYNNAVSTLANAGILSGYPDGTFRPNAPITRAEFAAIVTRFSSATAYGKASFTDVPSSHWASNAIALAEQLGWVGGYPDGTFRPDKAITRAETMTLVNLVLGRSVLESGMLPGMVTFRDNQPGAWYYTAVQEATNSHTYMLLTSQFGGITNESWTGILNTPDWAALEKSWSAANSR